MMTGEIRRYLRDHGTMIRRPRTLTDASPAIITARQDLQHNGH